MDATLTRLPRFDISAETAKEPEDAYLWRAVPAGIMSKGMKGQPAAYAPKRVDLTTILPSEILLEVRPSAQFAECQTQQLTLLAHLKIFSYLRPIALWRMLHLNKRIYALLSSPSGLALWHAAMKATAANNSVSRIFAILGRKRQSTPAPLPMDGGRPVNLIKIAALTFREDCQVKLSAR